MKQILKETGSLAKMRTLNRNAVLSYVRNAQASSRTDLGRELNLAPATVTSVVGDLMQDKLLVELEPGQSQLIKRNRGRPQRVVCLNPNAAFSMGVAFRVELGVLYIDTCFSNYCGQLTYGETLKCYPPLNFEGVFEMTIRSIDKLKDCLPNAANVVSLGLSVPGVVSDKSIIFSPYLSLIEGEALYDLLCESLKLPIYLDNDASVLMVRELERRPELRSANVSYLLISQGLGSSTSLSGQLWKASCWSGEIGHVEVPFEGQGLKSLEWILGLDGYFAKKMACFGIVIGDDKPISEVLLADDGVVSLLNSYATYLFLAVQALNGVMGLDVIVIGGRHSAVLSYCIPRLNSLIHASPLNVRLIHASEVQYEATEGAALLALQQSLETLHLSN